MEVSERGLAFVAAREACCLQAYRDSQLLAIGFGQNDPSLKEGDTITLDRAVELLVISSKAYMASINKLLAGITLAQQQIDAIFSLTYNIGAGAVSRNTDFVNAVKALAAEQSRLNRDLAAYRLISCNFTEAKGPANLSRRCREALMFISGDYGDLSTVKLWPAGTSPQNVPPDPPITVPMPTFLKS